jgi:hypothetical protein
MTKPSTNIAYLCSVVADPGCPFHIRIKEFKYFNPKNYYKDLGNMIRDVHPGYGSQNRILIFCPSRIQGSKSIGSGSATLAGYVIIF